jgi:aspartate/methionine/tyrosine aminotransferase
VRHRLWIVSDEIWSDIVYAPHRHVSMASLDREIASRVFGVYGFSKTFGLAGLRVGFIHAPTSAIVDRLIAMSGAKTTAFGVSTLSQIAATTAYEKCWYWADAFVAHLQKMRDYALLRLERLPGVSCSAPAGTYVLFPEICGTGRTSEELVTHWFEQARVAVAPGVEPLFGPGAHGHIRICYSTSHGILREAFDRIERVMDV